MLEIIQIEIYTSPIKLKEPFKISLGILTHANNVLVRIRTKEGLIGFGECSPFMTIHGESSETAVVVGQYLAKVLIGKSALDIAGNVQCMDAIIYGNSCIKSAFNIALYDIASQHANLPLYAFLGGVNNKTIQTDYTISIDAPQKMADDALKIKNNGFEIIKVKVGGDPIEDVERIRMIRSVVGSDIRIRIDANQGWSVLQAIHVLQAIEQFDIEHCEEPINRALYMHLPEIKNACQIPIMADESCCFHYDAQRLIDIDGCDSFNIKLSKSAGITDALQIIYKAEQAGKALQVGGFLESRLAFTAAAHVALVSNSICYYDFDTPLMFEEDPVLGGISYGERGIVSMPDLVGLGAVIDEAYLEKQVQIIIK